MAPGRSATMLRRPSGGEVGPEIPLQGDVLPELVAVQ